MALPKSMKRLAASPARGNEKKKLLKRSVAVVKAFKQSDMPDGAKKMLCEAAASALSVYSDQRHPFQAKVVSMAEKAFSEVETKLQAAVSAAQERIASLDESRLQDAVMRQAQALAHLKSALADREADEMEVRLKLPKVTQRVKSVQKDAIAGDLEHAEASRAKEKLDGILQTAGQMKAEALVKRSATKAISDLKSLGVDASLLATLHGVITKPVEERGEFDALTLSNLDAELAERAKATAARLGELEPARAQRDAVVAAAQEACDVVQEQVTTANYALTDAKSAAENGKELLKVAEGDLKDYTKNLKTAQENLRVAQKNLTDFQCGALQNFRTLQSNCTPSVSQVPEPPPASTQA